MGVVLLPLDLLDTTSIPSTQGFKKKEGTLVPQGRHRDLMNERFVTVSSDAATSPNDTLVSPLLTPGHSKKQLSLARLGLSST